MNTSIIIIIIVVIIVVIVVVSKLVEPGGVWDVDGGDFGPHVVGVVVGAGHAAVLAAVSARVLQSGVVQYGGCVWVRVLV